MYMKQAVVKHAGSSVTLQAAQPIISLLFSLWEQGQSKTR